MTLNIQQCIAITLKMLSAFFVSCNEFFIFCKVQMKRKKQKTIGKNTFKDKWENSLNQLLKHCHHFAQKQLVQA